MKLRLPLLLACVALSFEAAAQSKVRVLSTTMVPVRPYVGDVVECSMVFDPGGELPGEGPVSLPAASARNADVELVGASVQRKSGKWTYTARFIAWTPGPVRLPAAAPSGLSFPDIQVDIASVVADFGRDPPRYKDPMELKGTRLMVWSLAGTALAAAVLAWSLAFGFFPWLRRMRRAWREGRAGRDFARILDYLEKSSASLKPDELWALLAKALRRYMSARTGCPYLAYTAREAQAASPENLPREAASQAAALLAEGDMVRFARKTLPRDVSEALVRSRGILRQVEEAAHDGLR